ncbi:toll/interleukin-1 receptor domain-containing protein [Rhizobium hidalgonense]|uniref:toll/interleukin-1 receptor domain-containing protein n=1 Tax=Rhizobium hidalgonense TaxID=1538159 RepID=UPI0028719CAD|nr:toll/interleukin-1 receptor domain-containing protein [Rhizobium hidalgonense]MDR9805475.1 toll/interleukin-1 receptor domain-containing protein [Rhizobium hidalgonense]
MPKAFLAWQSNVSRKAPKLDASGSIVDRSDRPIGHKTGQLRLLNLIQEGDAIWIVGRYRNISDASVSLVGKIVIAEAMRDGDTAYFRASDQSVWFPWNDASYALRQILLKSHNGKRCLDHETDLAFQLQTTREIDENSYELLCDFEAGLMNRPKVFLSYNWSDSSSLTRTILPAIQTAGLGIWIDRWSGPRRFKDGLRYQPEELVKQLLQKAIASANVFIALIGDRYEMNNWTRYEMRAAEALLRPIVRLPTELLKHLPYQSAIDRFVSDEIKAQLAYGGLL